MMSLILRSRLPLEPFFYFVSSESILGPTSCNGMQWIEIMFNLLGFPFLLSMYLKSKKNQLDKRYDSYIYK